MVRIRSCIAVFVIVMTTSIVEMCLNEKSMTVANEFLINKWKMYYKSADVNLDGKLSIEDAQECLKNLFEMEHLDSEKWKNVKERFEKYWDECIFREKKGDISEQEFVDSLITDFNDDNEKFKKEVDRCYDMSFSGVDINEDQYISKDELLINYAAFGHQNISKDDGYFSAFNPSNGLVPYRDIVDSWVGFLTDTDESKGNIVQHAFEVDGVH